MIAEGDKVVLRCSWSETQQGSCLLAPAMGTRFAAQYIHIFRLANGKFEEHWAIRDDLGMLQQLGAIPTPDQKSKKKRSVIP
jgi:predicted ester cyclase